MDLKIERFIEEYVRRCERRYGQEDRQKYVPYVRKMGAIRLASITTKDVKGVIRPFLYRWGRMGRILGRDDYRGWEQRIAESIRARAGMLERLRREHLSNPGLDLAAHKLTVIQLYGRLKENVGPVAAAKTLHLVCPDFFPPWDNPIVQGYRTAIAERPAKSERTEAFSPDDYHRFMQEVRTLLLGHDRLLSCLAAKYAKSKVRILDECFWWAASRPLSMFF
jgi:hypothetical protein